MNILLIGSGGREHAIAWKLSQSPKLSKLYILPGNPGTAALGENITDISIDDHDAVAAFCREKHVDLVIVGPESPLAAGIVDSLSAAGIRCFGPRMEAARIESSKSFAKQFMLQHGIPTARYAVFKNHTEAVHYLEQVDYPVVIKASGLAAGKGVILPETKAETLAALEMVMIKRHFGAAGDEVVIEERLSGSEVSLMAFTDGRTVVPMLPAQDHKRLLDGDHGPNTGGMGAYAPAPACSPERVKEIFERVLQPTVDGLREKGALFVGVLYAGLMLTASGPQVLEFNCRFGDPETEAVLPLLETDLVRIAEACADGHLADVEIRWKSGAAVCVMLASEGYPGKLVYGKLVRGSRDKFEHGTCFHAGTRQVGGKIVTAGGRVLGVTAWDESLEAAVKRVYSVVDKISFEGMQFRRDIARRAFAKSAYAEAGVSIEAGARTVELLKSAVQATYSPAVLAGIGSFGGLFDAAAIKGMRSPVLVASTDGVGTKVKLAAAAGRYRSIGHDIVNHCINDILVQGARPLFFLDYFATSKLTPEITADVVTGIAEACTEAGISLLGGETAEMPGVYADGEFDVAGTIVGVVERGRIRPEPDLGPGDVILGLASSGPHTNGYSLIRKVFEGVPLETVFPELGIPLADALLIPHRSYLNVLYPHLKLVKALAHLTGGGFIENIPRVLPAGVDAVIRADSWQVPALFRLIQQRGGISVEEMYRVFKMGVGMVVIVDKKYVKTFQRSIPEETWVIGELVAGSRKVILK
ncbi:MAG: phosphoribosylamine--glycine ligase [Chloroflexi bacterium]|nr:phosphoribosylamine--glycine ligase [Chloroflexota bacterium]